MTVIRNPIDEPRLISNGLILSKPRFIDILHPGYDSSGDDAEDDILLSLRAFDDDGIDYDTAHTACAILAANQWDGYFSHDRDGSTRVQPPTDRILRDKSYYFCLPSFPNSSTTPYPIIARFSDWRFPHGCLPPIWRRFQRFQDQLWADHAEGQINSRHCCLSNYADPVESAHLVPVAQSSWWLRNNMARYSEVTSFSTDPMNALSNRLPLRSDVHKMFDERHFSFVPKIGNDRTNNGGEDSHAPSQPDSHTHSRRTNVETESTTCTTPCFVGHVFNSTPSGQLPMLWHNRRVHTLPLEVSVECLLARFAWTIFSPSVFRDFLNAEKPRRILVWDHELRKHKIEEAGPERCRSIYTAARSRSESPRKRSRGAGGAQQDSEGVDAHQDHDASSDVDSGYHDDLKRLEGEATMSPDEAQRGRTRKRKAEESFNPLLEAKCDNGRAKKDQSHHYISHRSSRLESYRPAKQARGQPYKTTESIAVARSGD